MRVIIYHDKKKSWRHASLRIENYQKPFFFHVSKTGFTTRKTPIRKLPKRHMWFNFFFFSYWRDNSNLRFGIGLGKKQLSLNLHCLI